VRVRTPSSSRPCSCHHPPDLDAKRWTALTYPTNTLIAAQTWMPAISVPAGYTKDGLPVGIELVGLPYREADLLSIAYSFEQLTKYRKAPASTPTPRVTAASATDACTKLPERLLAES
jgi:Asp-tRNA(Asn)/Glu-tRNA(Gln) amidotransferase A subunit family amidase